MKELIIYTEGDIENILLVENGILTEKYKDSKYKKRLEGNIYIGKVQNILPGLQAAFINVGENKNAFIHLKDVLPKVDVTKQDSSTWESERIENILKVGMPIIVEIKRDSYNKKGARASTHINLPGRYIVLLPNSSFVTISQKIEDKNERQRLISLTKNILPPNMGAIIRTSAVGKTEEDLENDLKILVKKWNDIISIKFDNQDFPKLISEANGMIDKLLLDLIDKDLKIIHVDNEEMKKIVEHKVRLLNKEDIQIVCDIDSVMLKYNIQHQLDVAENRKVWLKSGGFITIDKTEALTAIDVNSAKFIGKVSLENTAFLINKEAAVEIEKQIRLRDIGGIIIIDFIDLNDDEHKKELIHLFSEELKKERTRVQIEGFTKLNLLELTRKHIYSE
jgi:ribonuclease G